MTLQTLRTAEFVSPKHPDKICDFIADSLMDEFLRQDPASRTAIEVMAGHGQVTVGGEVRSRGRIDIASMVQKIVGPALQVNVNLAPQSEFIAHGVDSGGAGDQGIMVGYATSETDNFMPLEYDLARNLCQKVFARYPYDGKVQVTLNGSGNGHAQTVVASFQNSKSADLEALVRSVIPADRYLVNPAGEWTLGSFEADTGLSGRKIAMDSYGPQVPVGGGSFSGKDYTKVDRSGAYAARKIAVDLLKQHRASQVMVKLAYAIGEPEPVMAGAEIDGQAAAIEGYNLTPAGIKQLLQLDKFSYSQTSQWGHFGQNFIWDR